MNNYPIAVIDSGSGGLSILEEIMQLLPHESTMYIGDHKFFPYSEKTTAVIKNRIIKIIRFVLEKKAKMIVIACNTATVAGIRYYRTKFPEVPIIGVVPVVKTASLATKTHSFCIVSTEYTAKSTYQKKLIRHFAQNDKVISLASTRLVNLIESPHVCFDEIQNEVRTLLRMIRNEPVDVIVLGCTHFPFIRTIFQQVAGHKISIIDSGPAVARHVKRILFHNSIASTGTSICHEYFTTGDRNSVSVVFSRLLSKNVVVQNAVIS